jgi:hypothetical protein
VGLIQRLRTMLCRFLCGTGEDVWRQRRRGADEHLVDLRDEPPTRPASFAWVHGQRLLENL